MIQVFMVAIGSEYERIAAMTRPIAERALGIAIDLVTTGSPFKAKLQASGSARAGNCAMVIDADVVLRRWDWDSVNFDKINALELNAASLKRLNQDVLSVDQSLLHTGILIVPGELAQVSMLALELMQGELRWRRHNSFDEIPFSVACARSSAPVHLLDRSLLEMNIPGVNYERRDPHNVHFVGPKKLERIKAHIEKENKPNAYSNSE